MVSLLSNLVNNLAEGNDHNDQKCETYGIKYKGCDYSLEYTNFKDDLIEYKYLCRIKTYQNMIDENLKKQLFSTYKFSNHNINKFTLLLGVYPYENMDDWEKFRETLWPVKGDFYNHLNMEDITDADYTQTKIDLQSDALLLTDVFENFQNMCLEIYKLDPAWFLTSAGLHHKEEYVMQIRNLKQALNQELVLKNYIESLNLIKKIG